MKTALKYIILLSVFTGTSSCKDWLDVNRDPNNPSDVAPEFVLPVGQMSIAGTVGSDFAILGGLWAQHWTQSHVAGQYQDQDAYQISTIEYDDAWQEMYAGGLNDLEDVKRKAQQSGNNNMFLQAVAVQCYGYQILADWYDKIPLSEAHQVQQIRQPKYDDGPAVYAELIRRLDEALALDFGSAGTTVASSDLVFGTLGLTEQIDQWKRFCNTLKLKLYLRQTSSPNAQQAVEGIRAMLNSSTPFLNTHAAITQFIDEPSRSNPLYESNVRQLNVGTNLRLSRTFQSYLEANNDQVRLNAYFSPGPLGQYGLQQGDFNANATVILPTTPSVARMTAVDPFYFFSRDEVLFMLAEAYLRTGNDAQAKTYYDQGVEAAYAKFGVNFDRTKIQAGGVYAFPSAGTTQAKLRAIMMQKWVAMFRQGYESFWDQARTGYPEISNVPATSSTYVPGQWTVSVTNVTGNVFPRRLPFVSVSLRVNPNAPAQALVTDKVWWMR